MMLSVSKDCSHLASALNVSMGGRGCFFVSVTPEAENNSHDSHLLLESMIPTDTAGVVVSR